MLLLITTIYSFSSIGVICSIYIIKDWLQWTVLGGISLWKYKASMLLEQRWWDTLLHLQHYQLFIGLYSNSEYTSDDHLISKYYSFLLLAFSLFTPFHTNWSGQTGLFSTGVPFHATLTNAWNFHTWIIRMDFHHSVWKFEIKYKYFLNLNVP